MRVVSGARTASVKRLKTSELAGTAPEPELKGMMGRKLAIAVVLGGVMGCKLAVVEDLKVVIGRKYAPAAE